MTNYMLIKRLLNRLGLSIRKINIVSGEKGNYFRLKYEVKDADNSGGITHYKSLSEIEEQLRDSFGL